MVVVGISFAVVIGGVNSSDVVCDIQMGINNVLLFREVISTPMKSTAWGFLSCFIVILTKCGNKANPC